MHHAGLILPGAQYSQPLLHRYHPRGIMAERRKKSTTPPSKKKTSSAQPRKVAKKAARKVAPTATTKSAATEQPAAPTAPSVAPITVQKDLDELRRNMLRSIITEPLLSQMQERPDERFDVIISLNELYQGGLREALAQVERRAHAWGVAFSSVSNYVFARLTVAQIQTLARETQQLAAENRRAETVVYRIWEDSDIAVTLTRSLTTVKADAAQRAFHALGEGIVWAVLDSGIDGEHLHFAEKETLHGHIDSLGVRVPIQHRDYTPDRDAPADPATPAPAVPRNGDPSALVDRLGHGTHVAGIIGGYWTTKTSGGLRVVGTEMRDENSGAGSSSKPLISREALTSISGVAPLCKLVSLKVIADVTRTDDYRQTRGQGKVSWVLRAIEDIQQWNQYGRRLLIHGVNMSVGYEFDPRWFACGQSPLCAEVNRLVKSGVCVVVSAGNGGYSSYISGAGTEMNSYNNLSITDPGNAELAITVGSTHRDMPHLYGVSYFSSRGPTGDGRRKPDLLAPGERIRSCAAGVERDRYGVGSPMRTSPEPEVTTPKKPGMTAHAVEAPPAELEPDADRMLENGKVLYCEQSGTSMAAPHVSGAIAGFLSVRTEFIGQPEPVKQMFLQGAVDLGREPSFQGKGLLDLMKVLQAV